MEFAPLWARVAFWVWIFLAGWLVGGIAGTVASSMFGGGSWADVLVGFPAFLAGFMSVPAFLVTRDW